MEFHEIRTRFAPSPTGYMHVGNLRTALYAYLTAKHEGGSFLLRIEDTDQERYVEGAVDIIYNTLRETGLVWDEGPDIGGPVGPYIQSQRMGMFKGYAEELVKKGAAYYCFCDKDRLEEVRAVQQASGMAPKYDGHCRHLTPEEVQAKLDAGIPYVIRQKVPTEGSVTFHDQIFGDITVDCADLDDQVLIKADGMPTYNFANVVDDHTMGITHVIRGNEYLSSTPKYNLLYQAFGWEIPVYIHCPPVMKDATHKLSKRNGDASYEDLIAQGVDVIITTPCDTTALNSTLQEAMDEGIKVILLAAAIDGDSYDSLITVDEKDFGATGAKWLVEQLDGKGKLIMLEGISGFSTNTLRQEGALEVFEEYPDIEIVADEDADWDYAKAKTVASDLLATYPEIDGVWSQGGAMTLGAIESFQAAGRDLVPMTGEDNNGYLKACVDNNMEGIAVGKPTWLTRVALDTVLSLMNGEEVKKDNIYPVATIAGLKEMEEAYFPELSDDVWCGTELPEDVLKEVFK